MCGFQTEAVCVCCVLCCVTYGALIELLEDGLFDDRIADLVPVSALIEVDDDRLLHHNRHARHHAHDPHWQSRQSACVCVM